MPYSIAILDMNLFQDLKFSFRTLRKTPSVTLLALCALVLGIGATTALFTVVNAVLLRPLNYPEANRLFELHRQYPGGTGWAISAPKVLFWEKENHSFDSLGASDVMSSGLNLTGSGEPERLHGLRVTAGWFRALRVTPVIGRTFSPSEDTPGAGQSAVLSYGLWKRRFAGDPGILGKSIVLSGNTYTVLGVMPSDFRFTVDADLWVPMQMKMDPEDFSDMYRVLGRLKDGVSVEQANADLKVVRNRMKQQLPRHVEDNEQIGTTPYLELVVGDIRQMLLVLMGAVGFVLLIACANVANLLLARSAARRKELAVRVALGAGSWQIARQALTESLLLSFLATALGLLLAWASLPMLLHFAPAGLPRIGDVQLDGSVLVFGGAVAVLTGLLFGLAPLAQALRTDAIEALREGTGRGTGSASALRMRNILVVAEVAISLVLLIGAGLLIDTFVRLRLVSPGFDPRNVVTMQMSIDATRYGTTSAVSAMYDRTIRRLESVPGVQSAGTVTSLPLELGPEFGFLVEGRKQHAQSGADGEAQWRSVTPHYFDTMRMPVIKGRGFNERDTATSPKVVVISETLAREVFPHENPIGARLVMGHSIIPGWGSEIVGVVADSHDDGLDSRPPQMTFTPASQTPEMLTTMANRLLPANYVMRVSGNPSEVGNLARRALMTLDSQQPVSEPRLMMGIVDGSIARQQFNMLLLGLFAGLALLLGAIGLYGVISYSVVQRTRELGIRSALGARRGELISMVLMQGVKLTGAGLGVGLIAAFLLTRYLQSLLYGVKPLDATVFGSVCLVLAAVAVAASYIPALRAASIDPLVALRDE
jgi:putative ABC transport system permease protein